MSPFALWLFALLMSFAPPDRFARVQTWNDGLTETVEERTERYREIATDLEAVIDEDPDTLAFAGPSARQLTAALVLGVAFHESEAFAPDVDLGPCNRGANGKRCDSGRAACLMQVHATFDGRTREGWTLEELSADRRKCFRAGLNGLRSSLGMCRRNRENERLAAYASGSCDRGQRGSRELWAMFGSFLVRKPLPKEVSRGK
jgi:hypothetical protein